MPRLLFIGPKFYNYHLTIKKGFEDAGFEVDYFDDRPGSDFLTKSLIRINKKLLKRKIRSYFDSIKKQVTEKKYDVIFVLYGQSFTKEMMVELKEASPKSRFIFYMYDPLSSMPDRAEFVDIFDDCYSFDYNDCVEHPKFKLVPLFYSFTTNQDDLPKKYDVCAVVTMMPGKYRLMKEMVSELRQHGMSVYSLFYLQSKLVWQYYKIKKAEFRSSNWKEFTDKRLSNKEANEVLLGSTYILDCPKSGQSGLTIRTFEALAANKKLITTNPTVVKYDFYKPTNIYVYNGKFDFDDIFFHSEYSPVNDNVKEKYSINNWVKQILNNYFKEKGKI